MKLSLEHVADMQLQVLKD